MRFSENKLESLIYPFHLVPVIVRQVLHDKSLIRVIMDPLNVLPAPYSVMVVVSWFDAVKLNRLSGCCCEWDPVVLPLLPRFYDVSEGQIFFDGCDIRKVTLQSLRNQIGLVTQQTILFNDTVRNNIAYGRLTCSDQEVIEAAQAANAHDFITRLPQQYETVIGEQGVKLSGGERQRLSIARALLKNAPILILDEATSSVDTETELLIQQALERLMEGRTTIIIAMMAISIACSFSFWLADRESDVVGHDLLFGAHRFGVAAPPARQRASLHIHEGPDPWAIVDRKPLQIVYQPVSFSESMFRSGDDSVLDFLVKIGEECIVAGHLHNQIPVFFRLPLGFLRVSELTILNCISIPPSLK
jgi:ABC-type polar amino acid transport system ATPase subunit